MKRGARTHRWLPGKRTGVDHCFDCGAEKTRDAMGARCMTTAKPTILDDVSQAAALGMYLDGWRVRTNLTVSSPRFPLPVTFENAIAVYVMETARAAFVEMCDDPPRIAEDRMLPPVAVGTTARLNSREAARAIAVLCDDISPTEFEDE